MWWSKVGPLAAALGVVPPNYRMQATGAGWKVIGGHVERAPAAPDAER